MAIAGRKGGEGISAAGGRPRDRAAARSWRAAAVHRRLRQLQQAEWGQESQAWRQGQGRQTGQTAGAVSVCAWVPKYMIMEP